MIARPQRSVSMRYLLIASCLLFVGCQSSSPSSVSSSAEGGGEGEEMDGADGSTSPQDAGVGGGDGEGGGEGGEVDGGGPPVDQDGGPVMVDEDAGVSVDDGAGVCFPTTCAGKLLECGDCLDNDGDGKTDYRDPECLGPCDNTEGPGLSAGVGGVNRANCGVDCYFDFGNGPGNDDCHWDHRCDPLEPAADCSFDEDRLGGRDCPAEQSQQCDDFCRPYTPNGCDCFGCCTFEELRGAGPGGSDAHVWIGNLDEDNESTCTLDDLTNELKCPRCTPVESCFNDCGRCEVCIGKPVVPDDCFEGGGDEPDAGGGDGEPDAGGGDGEPDAGGGDGPDAGGGDTPGENEGQCPGGEQPCGQEGQAECERSFYCITGCCQFIN